MAVSRYTVVRYVPDPRREEYINIGVIVAADNGGFVDARFTSDWVRVQRFGQENPEFLKEFARLVRFGLSQGQDSLFGQERLDAAVLAKLAVDWHNSIQFSQPRASIAPDPKRLLDQLFATYVQETPRPRVKARSKQEIVARAKTALETAILREFSHDPPRVEKDDLLRGSAEIYEFDLVVRNGTPYLGVQGVSFHRVLTEDLKETVQSMAFEIQDVRGANPAIALAVVAIPPIRPRADYERALRIYENIRVPVIVEPELPDWASQTMRDFSKRIALSGKPEEPRYLLPPTTEAT